MCCKSIGMSYLHVTADFVFYHFRLPGTGDPSRGQVVLIYMIDKSMRIFAYFADNAQYMTKPRIQTSTGINNFKIHVMCITQHKGTLFKRVTWEFNNSSIKTWLVRWLYNCISRYHMRLSYWEFYQQIGRFYCFAQRKLPT